MPVSEEQLDGNVRWPVRSRADGLDVCAFSECFGEHVEALQEVSKPVGLFTHNCLFTLG